MAAVEVNGAGEGRLALTGELTYTTVAALWAQREKLLTHAKENALLLDLQQVPAVDSAGMAFLVSLIRAAKQKKIHIKLGSASKQVLNIAKVSGLSELLPFS